MACRHNVRIQLHLTFKIKLIPGKGFVKTIAADCFVFVEDLVFFADKRTLFVLYVFDWNRLDTWFELVKIITLYLTFASDQLRHAVEKVVSREVIKRVL